ncbi:RHS repeat protein, partial [Enterobacter hormaechei]
MTGCQYACDELHRENCRPRAADYPQRVRPSRPTASPGRLYRQCPTPAAAPLVQDGTLPGQEQWRWDAAGNPLEGAAEKVT